MAQLRGRQRDEWVGGGFGVRTEKTRQGEVRRKEMNKKKKRKQKLKNNILMI
jgi:hypothetical protein